MDLVSRNNWDSMDRNEFLTLFSATYMDDFWYMTLCDNLNNQMMAKGWIAMLLSNCLDLRTHLCIAEIYPEIVISSYEMIKDGFGYENRSSFFLKKFDELTSTVGSAISLSQ